MLETWSRLVFGASPCGSQFIFCEEVGVDAVISFLTGRLLFTFCVLCWSRADWLILAGALIVDDDTVADGFGIIGSVWFVVEEPTSEFADESVPWQPESEPCEAAWDAFS